MIFVFKFNFTLNKIYSYWYLIQISYKHLILNNYIAKSIASVFVLKYYSLINL